MKMRLTLAALVFACAPLAVAADAGFQRLTEVLDLDAYIEITRQEGLEELDALSRDMLGRPAGAAFIQQMTKVYDAARLRNVVRAALQERLTPDQITASLIFWDSETGAQIGDLELAARRAISDPDIETAARLAWVQAEDTRPELVKKINTVTSLNDLVERNVSGALNSNFRFYQGMADGNGLNLSEAEMIAEVWGQETEIRIDTAAWLGAYQLLAYQPLPDAVLDDYILYWQTQTGQALNAALFDSFNLIYDEVSYATGRVIALNMGGQDL
ncbi:MAG: hypothetical protein AB8B71_17945 [Paracoccaceae bacterium]